MTDSFHIPSNSLLIKNTRIYTSTPPVLPHVVMFRHRANSILLLSTYFFFRRHELGLWPFRFRINCSTMNHSDNWQFLGWGSAYHNSFIYTEQQNTDKHRHTSMPRVGFIPGVTKRMIYVKLMGGTQRVLTRKAWTTAIFKRTNIKNMGSEWSPTARSSTEFHKN
jgi:hypothetical protein